MPVVSVTRLRLRGLRHLPGFAWATWRGARQLRGADGFLGGQLAGQGRLTFWTLTVWRDEASLGRYRAAGAHGRAMPALARWCDEASLVRWRQDGADLPSPAAAQGRLAAEGRLSKVRHPSPAHAAGQVLPSREPLRPGPRLRPRARRAADAARPAATPPGPPPPRPARGSPPG